MFSSPELAAVLHTASFFPGSQADALAAPASAAAASLGVSGKIIQNLNVSIVYSMTHNAHLSIRNQQYTVIATEQI